ncbi:hypothetical protein JMUB7507_26510 [Staphylococcus aureus]
MTLKYKIEGESVLAMLLQNTIAKKKQARNLLKRYELDYRKHHLASNN